MPFISPYADLPYNWQDYLFTASFRGVQFYTETHGLQTGRRTVTHEFPGRDTPYTEDLGKRAQRYITTCYVIGYDYPLQRDNLIAACSTILGPGTLQFPDMAPFQALCESCGVEEHRERGNIATLQCVFVEAGSLDGYGVSLNTAAAAATAATNLVQTAGTTLDSQLASIWT